MEGVSSFDKPNVELRFDAIADIFEGELRKMIPGNSSAMRAHQMENLVSTSQASSGIRCIVGTGSDGMNSPC